MTLQWGKRQIKIQQLGNLKTTQSLSLQPLENITQGIIDTVFQLRERLAEREIAYSNITKIKIDGESDPLQGRERLTIIMVKLPTP